MTDVAKTRSLGRIALAMCLLLPLSLAAGGQFGPPVWQVAILVVASYACVLAAARPRLLIVHVLLTLGALAATSARTWPRRSFVLGVAVLAAFTVLGLGARLAWRARSRQGWRRFVTGAAGSLVLVVASPFSAYFAYNIPVRAPYAALAPSELQPYTDHLRQHGQTPAEYVEGKFTDHDVVILGEMHRTAEDAGLVASLVPCLSRRGVRTLAIEFGDQRSQADADRLLTAPEFDRAAVVSLLRRWYYLWNYEEYLGIYRAVWEVNRALPPEQEKFRLVLLGSAESRSRDDLMYQVFWREVLKPRRKALVYCGLHHAFTRYRQPLAFFVHGGRRLGHFVREELGERVFLIGLHHPFFERFGFYDPLGTFELLYPFGGVLDQAFEAKGGRSVGFDLSGSPFGELTDRGSYYGLDRWRLRWREMADGWIMLAPLDRLHRVRAIDDWLASPGAWEDLHASLPRARSPEEFLEALRHDGLDIERVVATRLHGPRFWSR